MKRRPFIAACIALALAPAARGEQKLRRVGWLTGGSPKSHAKLLEAFRYGLREHGWMEGKNIALELRWAEGKIDRAESLARDLVRLEPEIILTAATPMIAAVKKATSTIPIVMATGSDPVALGFVNSLARPGGNITGLSGFFEATPNKMLELVASVVPRGSNVVVLVEAKTPFAEPAQLRSTGEAARAVGVRHEIVSVGSVEQTWSAMQALAKQRPGALVVMPGPMMFFLARDLPAKAAALRVPVIYPFEDSAEAGGLMSYAASLADSYRRAARYVDLILRGANPGELPIEQPTRLALSVNLKTARAQGIAIPREVVLRADRVIE